MPSATLSQRADRGPAGAAGVRLQSPGASHIMFGGRRWGQPQPLPVAPMASQASKPPVPTVLPSETRTHLLHHVSCMHLDLAPLPPSLLTMGHVSALLLACHWPSLPARSPGRDRGPLS